MKGLFKNVNSMLKVDFRRTFTTRLIYITFGVCFLMPILILVMTSAMAGTTSVNPTTGAETTIESFKNVWQIIGSVSGGESQGMSMDMTAMCNINLLYFLISVIVCLFVSDDFRSGYAKNLFTVRPRKTDYVISKFVVCFVCACVCFILFFIGAMIGGAIANLPFTLEGVTVANVIFCMISKIFLSSIFVSTFLLASVIAKQKTWLSFVCSLGIGMLFFPMIAITTPLNATVLHVILCAVGGGLFSVGLGFASKVVLKKTALV